MVIQEMDVEAREEEEKVVVARQETMGGGDEREVGVVRFQMGKTATTDSLLDTGLGLIPTLRQV